jgi:NAD(P)H-hydrate epimerase
MEDWLEPLHDAQTMRAADSWAIEERGIPSLELMEAAGLAVAEATEELAGRGPVRFVCGKGNNGGDGLVAARRLASFGHPVEVLLLWPADQLSSDASANLERFEGGVRELAPGETAAALAGSGAIVDAIFGTGFAGAPREPAASAIEAINANGAPVIAADIASGVDASTGEVDGVAIEATATVSFHAPKLGQRIAPGKWACGELRVAGIGIPDRAPGEPPAGLISPAVLGLAPQRGARSTKFSSGQVVIAGGSRGLTGAVCLSAAAAGRAGAGYVTVAVPEELELIFEAKLTEVMSRGCPSAEGALVPAAAEPILATCERAAAVVLGPGLGRAEASRELVGSLVGRIEAPLVIDADGLNALAGSLETLAERPAPAVLTPHAGELGRLLERDSAEVSAHRLAGAREAAERSRSIVVLKGDDTIVAAPDGRLAVNQLSSPALATAGTGDVLSGLTAALLARGVEPFAAACAAVYAHTRAGRIAAERLGAAESVIAGDVIEALPAGLAPEVGRR